MSEQTSSKPQSLASDAAKPERPFYNSSTFRTKEPSKRFLSWLEPHDTKAYIANTNWRIFRIMAEFIEGFEFLSQLHNEVSIFGSSRNGPKDQYYEIAVELGKLCAKNGYTIITGGGPGIMEAANKGAFEAGGESVGLDIEMASKQRRNDFVTAAIGFHHFFTRKVMLSAAAQAYVFFPGGFGTLDEATEMLTLVQTGKVPANVPCIFVGKEFWSPFVKWISETVCKENNYIDEKDLGLIQVVDTAQEALEIIKKTTERNLD